MSADAPSPPDPPPQARPVASSERIVLIDVLRGFALCGVFLSNFVMWFSGSILLPEERLQQYITSPVDIAAAFVVMILIIGKFFTIFTVLFGLGFAIQMGRASDRGVSIAPLYARRLVVLMLMGLVHLFVFWYGDILHLYAVAGFALLLFRRRSDRTLIIWGFILSITVMFVAHSLDRFVPMLYRTPDQIQTLQQVTTDEDTAVRAKVFEAFSGSSYLTMLRANAMFFWHEFMSPMLIAVFLFTVGRFLLGFYAGRRRLFHDVQAHLRVFKWMLWGGLAVGLLAGGGVAVLRFLTMKKILSRDAPWLVLAVLPSEMSTLALAAFYVAALSLLFQRSFFQRLLALLAPFGQMALTNYLAQTVISLFIFYGLGLGYLGTFSPKLSMGVAASILVVQIGFSHLWLSRFRFGPIEWIWRSLTYGKAQPMRRNESDGGWRLYAGG